MVHISGCKIDQEEGPKVEKGFFGFVNSLFHNWFSLFRVRKMKEVSIIMFLRIIHIFPNRFIKKKS